MTSQHNTGTDPFYIGMYIHICTHIYVHMYTSQKESLCIFLWDTLHSISLHSVIEHFSSSTSFNHISLIQDVKNSTDDCLNPYGLLCAFQEGSVREYH